MSINEYREAMSLIETILNPILPHPEDRAEFLRFLKLVRDVDEPMVCVITGKGNTGKSTLTKLAATVVERDHYILPIERMLRKIRGKYIYFTPDFKLGILLPEYPDDFSKCFTNLTTVLSSPENFGKRHYLVQGDFDFSDMNMDPSKCIHIHLDNEIPFLSTQLGIHIRDILESEQEDIRQEMKDILDYSGGAYIKG